MERLNLILVRLEEMSNEPFTQKRIDEMVNLNREKDELIGNYQKKYFKAYKEAGTNKQKSFSLN